MWDNTSPFVTAVLAIILSLLYAHIVIYLDHALKCIRENEQYLSKLIEKLLVHQCLLQGMPY